MVDEEQIKKDQVKEFYADIERKQKQDFRVGNRKSPHTDNILLLLGRMLNPQTQGFKQINMDMAFTYLDAFDVMFVKNSSFLINFCQIHGFRKSEYIERGNLATHLIARRSFQGKSMELFTTTVTKQEQSYADKTPKKTGFLQSLGASKPER